MSIRAITWALKDAPAPDPLSHLVLLGLADHTDSDGRGAWPSIRKLAEYARCSERTVHSRLRTLEEHGLIRRGDQRMVGHLPGNRRPVVYDLSLGMQEMHPTVGVQEVQGCTPTSSRGAQPRHSGVHAVADKPSLEPSLEPSLLTTPAGAADRLSQTFDDWWAHWPKKVDKGHARTAYKAALKKTSAEELLAAVQAYAATTAGTEKKYIPNPATWLNGERWDDDPTPRNNSQIPDWMLNG